MSSHETDKQKWAHMEFAIQILITENLLLFPCLEKNMKFHLTKAEQDITQKPLEKLPKICLSSAHSWPLCKSSSWSQHLLAWKEYKQSSTIFLTAYLNFFQQVTNNANA